MSGELVMEKGGRILIIDDDESASKAAESLFKSEGYELLHAARGSEGLALAHTYRPDLILLDVMMPGMNGYQVCHCLRDDPELADVVIVMISTLDDYDSRLRAAEVGADDYVSKPFDRMELKARVRMIMRLSRQRRLHEEYRRLEKAYHDLQQTYDMVVASWAAAQSTHAAPDGRRGKVAGSTSGVA